MGLCTGSSAPPPSVFTPTDVVNAIWWFVAIHHYYLDQRIWRVSRDKRLRADLKLQTP